MPLPGDNFPTLSKIQNLQNMEINHNHSLNQDLAYSGSEPMSASEFMPVQIQKRNTLKAKTNVAQEPYGEAPKFQKVVNSTTPNTKGMKTLTRKKISTTMTSSAFMNLPRDLLAKCNTPINMNSMPSKKESDSLA